MAAGHDHGAIRGLRDSPLVGRERELDELSRAVEEALSGGGRIVSLVGEAGLGKSRLIAETRAEWERRLPDDPAPDGDDDLHRMWETWQCVSYDATRPYSQYRRTVARIAGIEDTDPPDVVRAKLAGTIEHGSEDWLDPHMRVWRSLFGVTEPGEEPLEGEAFRDAIMELVTSSTRAFGADEPRLMVFEDLHWCDEASMDVLIETAKLVDELPCLFVFAFRPDRQAPSWRLKQWLETEYPHRSTELALTSLSEDESGRSDRRAHPERGRGRSGTDPRPHRREPAVPRGGCRRGPRAPGRHRDPDHAAGALHRAARRARREGQAHAAARLGHRPVVLRAGPASRLGRRGPLDLAPHPGTQRA